MANELRTLLQNYLDGGVGLDDVRAWVALNIFEAPGDAENDVDRLAIELSHLDGGTVDEAYFRRQVEGMLAIIVNLEVNEWASFVQYLPPGSSVKTFATTGPATPPTTPSPVPEWQPA